MRLSKFKTFIFSMIPGGGHLYLGVPTRGLLFLFSFISFIFLESFTNNYHNSYLFSNIGRPYNEIIHFALVLLYLYSIYDAFRIRNNMEKGIDKDYEELHNGENKKTLAIILCIVPGLGHIYLGRDEKGYRILSLFLLVYILNAILPFQILSLVLALIILYSIMNLSEYTKSTNTEEKIETYMESGFNKFKNSYMLYIGVILILSGILIIGNRIAFEFVDERILREIYSYLKEGILSLVLIFLGVKLIVSNKFRKKV